MLLETRAVGSSDPAVRVIFFHAMQPMAVGVRTTGPSRLRLVRDRRRTAVNGHALVIACAKSFVFFIR